MALVQGKVRLMIAAWQTSRVTRNTVSFVRSDDFTAATKREDPV